MLASNFALVWKSIFAGVFGDKDATDFWESRFLPGWLPVLLGLLFGIASSVLIVNGLAIFLIPLALLVPVTIVFIRYPFAAVILWILVFPYFVETPTTGHRVMYSLLHRAMIPAALGIVILSDWFRIRRQEPVRFGRAELAMLVFLLLALANIFLLTPQPGQALVRFYDRLFVPFCMYWLIRLANPTEKDLSRLVWAGFITVIVQAAIGFLGWFAPHTLPIYWLGREGERTVGTFGNPAVYTSTLIFLSLLLFQYAMQRGSRWMRAVALGTFILACFCVFFSFSRGSWLGGMLVLLGLVFVYPKQVLRLAIVGSIVVLGLSSSILADEVSWAFTRLQDAETAQGRVLGATTSIRMIQQKPWLGWGFGAYDLYDEQFKTRVGDLPIREEQSSHNTYLLIMAEMGLIALPLYLFPTLWWLVLTRKVRRRMPRRGMGSWHLLALLWLLMLDHFTVSNFMEMLQSNLFGTTIWWMALGLIASLIYPYLTVDDAGPPKWALQLEHRA